MDHEQLQMQDEAQDSQREPKHDSGLQTPQPDQPIPSESQEPADPDYDVSDDVSVD